MSDQLTKSNKWLLCLLLASTPAAYALESDLEKPITVEADTAVCDKNAGTAVYDGKVIIKQGSLEILATHVDIIAPDSVIQEVTATGSPVDFKQMMDGDKQAHGKAQKMQYYVKDKRLILTGDAELHQNQDQLTGNYIEYLPDNGQIIAKGKGGKTGRISATFFPSDTTAKPTDKTSKTDKKPAE
jgi:lipopolysaccharide export system protein LptA